MTAYYNEIDPYAAQWIRNLIDAGHIAKGDVDERDIQDVRSDDLKGYTQCHFFAGIGGWSLALKQAGWQDERPVWTGSCPCQPFSAAGKGDGFADERHLWPAFFHLIRECSPNTVFGEQVASKDGLSWFGLVQADMEGEGYACGAVDTCAAGFGAPHIRQRLYWVANSCRERLHGKQVRIQSGESRQDSFEARRCCGIGDLAYTDSARSQGYRRPVEKHDEEKREKQDGFYSENREYLQPGPINGFWRDADWLFCQDGKWRSVEPSTFPLANGLSRGMGRGCADLEADTTIPRKDKGHRVGRLRGYGNAIVPQCAQAFIESFCGR